MFLNSASSLVNKGKILLHSLRAFCFEKQKLIEEKVVVVHRGAYNNNKVCYRLSHDVFT